MPLGYVRCGGMARIFFKLNVRSGKLSALRLCCYHQGFHLKDENERIVMERQVKMNVKEMGSGR